MYECASRVRDGLERSCKLALPAEPIDGAFAERLTGAITPLRLELALATLTALEQRDRAISAQWRMRIERAKYEADLAERRYDAVDPNNRLITATLEQRWNEALQRLRDLEAELATFEQQTMPAVTAEQKQQILQLVKDFPRLWKALTTTAKDRKRILRLLVRDITVVKGPGPKVVSLQIRWQGGETETMTVALPPNRADAIRYADEFVDRIRAFALEHHDDEIAALMTAEGRQSSTGKVLTAKMIGWIRCKHRIPAPKPPTDTLSVHQVSQRYGVTSGVVYYWIQQGVVSAQQHKRNKSYAITVDDATEQILRDWVAKSNRLVPTSPTLTA
jgi:hypothetical protein